MNPIRTRCGESVVIDRGLFILLLNQSTPFIQKKIRDWLGVPKLSGIWTILREDTVRESMLTRFHPKVAFSYEITMV